MEVYTYNYKPDIDFYSRHLDREDTPPYLPHHAQLPPFRDIISPYLHTVSSTHPQGQSALETQSVSLTPTTQTFSATSRSLATSPAQSQDSSMPSLTDGFEDVSVRGNDTMFATQTQPTMGLDRTPSWISNPQYQTVSSTYNVSTPRMGQLTSQSMTSRSPNLPSLRDMQRTSTFDPTYAAANAQIAYVSQAPSYSQLYSNVQTTAADLDSTAFGARTASYDNNQYARFPATYPQTTRTYQTNDYGRYTSSFDPYRLSSSAYRTFPDMGYSSHPLVGSSQPASYGVPGDLSGHQQRRRRGNLPKHVTDILRSWFHDHLDHPYPSEEDKQIFIQKTGLTISQISNWFINARRRHWPLLRQNRDRQRNNALRRSNSAGGSM